MPRVINDNGREYFECGGCGKRFERLEDMSRIYDRYGIYAGRWCSLECCEKHMNLNYTRQDAAECGEDIEGENYDW